MFKYLDGNIHSVNRDISKCISNKRLCIISFIIHIQISTLIQYFVTGFVNGSKTRNDYTEISSDLNLHQDTMSFKTIVCSIYCVFVMQDLI